MGFGTWSRPGDEAAHCVTWALEAGCRHIDTAQGYNNEQFCGQAIADFRLQTLQARRDRYGTDAC
jgi:2,5-diketo-D-gluconate reductase B